ncbi:putative secondary metabolism biosyntheticenzyme [Clathrus columnatus]|uniref:Secondary metabolism biosyntheticenzyme n=1 Tax=Clathrus columnatus TaxID=1419009 RepID=A0AAV5ACT9_9AGAM|nr:putative secondary metabolism biosyntheticenzyme [Clathrus columnatus]
MSTGSTMKALYYKAPREFDIRQVPVPQCGDDEILVKGEHICYVLLIAVLIPGHEGIGRAVDIGKNVKGFQIGDRIVADVGITSKGVIINGAFAEYVTLYIFLMVDIPRFKTESCRSHQMKCYKVNNLTDEEATLLEPAACAIHGLDKLNPPVGTEVLLLGAGPTGLILAQLLKLNGALRVVIAANKGMKMDIAKKLNCGDEYVELDRKDAQAQWDKLKLDNPYGFDIVIEATGVEKLANDAIHYVRRGGTLMIYGVYENKALVHWPPSKIFGDEITIIGSFSQTYCFPRAVAYLDSKKINVTGMVTDVFKLEDYQLALDKMNSRQCLKIAIKPY